METHFTSYPAESRKGTFAPTPASRPGAGARVWAGLVIVVGGLGLIVLGGCFLYGVLEVLRLAEPHGAASPAASTLLVVLYVMAFLCFVGAGVLLAIGLWGLTRILMERPIHPEIEP
jgi:hypothetical protein